MEATLPEFPPLRKFCQSIRAVKNGLLGSLRYTPAGQLANMVQVGMENAKALFKLATGEINSVEALDAMANVTCSTVGSLWGGMTVGGLFGGPVGIFVGAVVGGMAGNFIGESIYTGAKMLAKTAMRVAEPLWEGAKEAVKAVERVLNPVKW